MLVETTTLASDHDGVYRTANEFVDYALLDRLGRPLAIVEAKRTSRHPLEGERQAADYADALRAHGSISRSKCEEILDVPERRAKYLLLTMEKKGLLRLVGKGRGSKYVLPL